MRLGGVLVFGLKLSCGEGSTMFSEALARFKATVDKKREKLAQTLGQDDAVGRHTRPTTPAPNGSHPHKSIDAHTCTHPNEPGCF